MEEKGKERKRERERSKLNQMNLEWKKMSLSIKGGRNREVKWKGSLLLSIHARKKKEGIKRKKERKKLVGKKNPKRMLV